MCKCNCQEVGRERLGLVLAIFNTILSLLGIVTIGAAVYMRLKIEDKVTMLGGYSGSAFTDYLLATGSLMVIINGVVAKVAYDCSDEETRGPFRNILLLFVVLLFALAIVVLLAAILCYGHHHVIDNVLSKGFLNAMKKYKTTQTVKRQMDELQADFACCGGDSFVDWFHVSWIHEDYINRDNEAIRKKIKGGEYFTDDVPFSCCDVTASRPCVHHAVAHSSQHPNIRETLNKEGCNTALKWYFQNRVFAPCGHVAIIAFVLEMLATILFRLLQTSIHSALQGGDPIGDGEAFCCSRWPCSCCNPDAGDESNRRNAPIGNMGGGPLELPDFGDGKSKKDKHKDKKDKKSNKQKDATSKKNKSTKQTKPGKSPRGSPTNKKSLKSSPRGKKMKKLK